MNALCHVVSKIGLLASLVVLCVGCRDDDYNYIPDIIC